MQPEDLPCDKDICQGETEKFQWSVKPNNKPQKNLIFKQQVLFFITLQVESIIY